jgi:hypothetical protein
LGGGLGELLLLVLVLVLLVVVVVVVVLLLLLLLLELGLERVEFRGEKYSLEWGWQYLPSIVDFI